MRNTSPMLKANVEMLRHVSDIYSSKIFEMFQQEYIKSLDCTAEKISKTEVQVEYKIKYVGRVTDHLVRFEPSRQVVDCSCKKFDFVKILCTHALKVLDKKNIK
ncbi:Protein FAR1-RELATED SEQUENCE 9 [Linum grandiflorum]